MKKQRKFLFANRPNGLNELAHLCRARYYFLILKGAPCWKFIKKLPLESKLLLILERICETVKMLYSVNANRSGASNLLRFVVFLFCFTIWHWKALAPYRDLLYILWRHSYWCCTAHHGILALGYSALSQCLQTFQIILGSGGGKTFFGKSKMGWLFQILKNVHHPQQ